MEEKRKKIIKENLTVVAFFHSKSTIIILHNFVENNFLFQFDTPHHINFNKMFSNLKEVSIELYY